MVDASSTTVVAIGTVVVTGSAVVVGETAAVDGTAALAGVVVVVRATVVVVDTAVVVGATVVVGTAFVVGVMVGAESAVDVVVAVVVVDSAEVEVGTAVSELPPHPETTNKTVTATACALTFQVCHPSPVRGGVITGASRCRYVQRLKGRRMASRSGCSGLVARLGGRVMRPICQFHLHRSRLPLWGRTTNSLLLFIPTRGLLHTDRIASVETLKPVIRQPS